MKSIRKSSDDLKTSDATLALPIGEYALWI